MNDKLPPGYEKAQTCLTCSLSYGWRAPDLEHWTLYGLCSKFARHIEAERVCEDWTDGGQDGHAA